MKASLEEAVEFEIKSEEWMKSNMKALLPPHLFALMDNAKPGAQKKVNDWLKRNGIDIQSNPSVGIRIIKNGALYSQISSVPDNDPSLN